MHVVVTEARKANYVIWALQQGFLMHLLHSTCMNGHMCNMMHSNYRNASPHRLLRALGLLGTLRSFTTSECRVHGIVLLQISLASCHSNCTSALCAQQFHVSEDAEAHSMAKLTPISTLETSGSGTPHAQLDRGGLAAAHAHPSMPPASVPCPGPLHKARQMPES